MVLFTYGRLSADKALGQLLGMERWADESTLGEWLRAQDKESLKALWAIIREFVGWALDTAKPGRVRHGGQLEVFFDDTQTGEAGQRTRLGSGSKLTGLFLPKNPKTRIRENRPHPCRKD